MTEPIPDHLVRALAYVNLANVGGDEPTTQELDAFSALDVPAGPDEADVGQLTYSYTSRVMLRGFHSPAEPVSNYMIGVGWVVPTPGLRLTRLGRAVLRGVEMAAMETEGVGLTVISPEDPLKYAALTRAIAAAGEGLLFDPYFKADMLSWLGGSTTIRRVLIREARRESEKKDHDLFPMYLGHLEETADVEVRVTTSDTLHDRGVIHDDGAISLMGTSLSGIGKHLTTIVPLPAEAGQPWREHIERLWEDARPIVPTTGGLRVKLDAPVPDPHEDEPKRPPLDPDTEPEGASTR
jgi:hypothetical protein